MTEFRQGDRVKWKSHGGDAVGRVERNITAETELAGREVSASKDEPQYLVKSEKSGGKAGAQAQHPGTRLILHSWFLCPPMDDKGTTEFRTASAKAKPAG